MQPLRGLKVLEMESIGPVPWCAMLLAHMGAEVTRIVRKDSRTDEEALDITLSQRREWIELNLKTESGRAEAMERIGYSDILLEGMRPGVMERLGLGPLPCLGANPRLIYGRMTGWGQGGPLAARAGHDINYIALTGALHAIGPADGPPVPPLNLLGDYGGGGAFLAIGVLAALADVRAGGDGRIVDAAMVDGVSTLMALPYSRLAAELWHDRRGSNILDGGVPWYGVYQTSDGGYIAVGAIEEAFYAQLLQGLGIPASSLPPREDSSSWPLIRERFQAEFRKLSRSEWERRFEGLDACVTPVLSMTEAPHHPHMRARSSFVRKADHFLPSPAPRFIAGQSVGVKRQSTGTPLASKCKPTRSRS